MRKSTRAVTLSAFLAALGLVILFIASVWPTGQIGLAALASIFAAAAVIEMGPGRALAVYAVTSALSMLLLPVKTVPLLYVLFFGYYPIVKSLAERMTFEGLRWVVKLAVFNAALTVVWFVMGELVFDFGETEIPLFLLYIGGSVVFAVYDYGFTKVIWFYQERMSKYIKRK